MKLATVQLGVKRQFGVIVDDGFINLSSRMADDCSRLEDLFDLRLLDKAKTICLTAKADETLESLTFLSPLSNGRAFALGVAYKEHQLEVGRADAAFPNIFPKFSSSFVGHGEPITRPSASGQFDFEGEIVIVIGKSGRHIPEESALGHIAGYSIANDGSVRDWQKHSLVAGKNFDRSSAMGPWIVTSDEIADPGLMQLTTHLNGNVMQQACFNELLWTPAFLVHYISTFTQLESGDMILTGTPAGVGHRRTPPLFLKPGDLLEISVSGIGTLSNVVADEVVQRA